MLGIRIGATETYLAIVHIALVILKLFHDLILQNLLLSFLFEFLRH